MVVKTIITGNIEENCHLFWDENKHCMVIDPGDDCSRILKEISEQHLFVGKIILTHGHYDHVGAVNELKKATGAAVIAHEEEKELIVNPELSLSRYISPDFSIPEVDFYVKEGDVISVGSLSLTVMHTPGHTQGGMCLYGHGILFSGDTVFYGTLGRWDFPTGDLSKLTHSIIQRIFSLPDDTIIHSGHGPATTVGAEKQHNEVFRWSSI
ncbi:MAG: MBL fold metallo-hydrolase [Clostridia bacterium]|nr:MBL fold metallo-hydrolase [Clostridia bacterium]